MSIYTKTGDKGTTALFDGKRVKKYDDRVETYGTFDELNAHISVSAKFVTSEKNRELLKETEKTLFYLCAELATENVDNNRQNSRLNEKDIKQLEKVIDDYTSQLPEVKSFILPGSSQAGAFLHVARTVARRGERLLVRLHEQISIRPELLQYVNRLSDFLYIVAREEDFRQKVEQVAKNVTRTYQQREWKFQLEEYQRIASYVESEATKQDIPVSMAIVDQHGVLRFSYSMDDALLVSHSLAYKKAYTAVAMKSPTHELSKDIQPGKSLYQLETMMDGQIVTFGGGFPIQKDGRIIGGLGISGGTVDQDMAIGKQALSDFMRNR